MTTLQALIESSKPAELKVINSFILKVWAGELAEFRVSGEKKADPNPLNTKKLINNKGLYVGSILIYDQNDKEM